MKKEIQKIQNEKNIVFVSFLLVIFLIPLSAKAAWKQDFQTAFLSTNFKGEPPCSMLTPVSPYRYPFGTYDLLEAASRQVYLFVPKQDPDAYANIVPSENGKSFTVQAVKWQ